MSFLAKLKLDNDPDEMNVLHCDFPFSQGTDVTGKPTAIPKGGSIRLILESDGSTHLFDWMIDPIQLKSGIITFYRRDSMSKLKTLEFTDAYCVCYNEVFDHTGEAPMQTELTVSAREVKLNNSVFKNNWPV